MSLLIVFYIPLNLINIFVLRVKNTTFIFIFNINVLFMHGFVIVNSIKNDTIYLTLVNKSTDVVTL